MTMDTNDNATSGALSDTSGSDNQDIKNETPEVIGKLKKEKDNYIKKAQSLEEQVKVLNDRLKLKDEEDLRAKEQWKQLYENEKKEKLSVQTQLSTINTQIAEGEKLKAVKKELFKMGLAPEFEDAAMKLINRSNIVFDEETKTIVGAEEVAKEFFSSYQTLGFFRKGQGNSNTHAAPNMQPGKIDLSKMTTDEKLRYLKERRS